MNLTPALYPLTLERGTKVTYAFIAKATASGPAIDLTGTTFTGQIRRSYGDKSSLMIPLTFTITDAVNGAFEFTIDDSNFALIPAELTIGVYDVLWLASNGSKPKILRGPVTINGTATRPA